MHLNLGEPYETYIQDEIKAGLYSNATELIRDALRRMKENKERRRIQHIHALVAIGEAQIAKGEGIPYTDDFMDSVMKGAIENLNAGTPIPHEVKPGQS
jgi:antitoxin ParD1/3/4